MKRAMILALLVAACGGAEPFSRPAVVQEPAAPASKDVAAGDQSFRAAPPSALDPQPARKLETLEKALANGVRVVMMPRHDFPSATVELVLDRGTASAPPGVAALYARSLHGSSRAYDRKDAQEYLRYVGASVRTGASSDSVTMEITALAPLIVSALSRAVPMFISPKLDGDDVEHARAFLVSEAVTSRGDPTAVAMDALTARLFPAPNAYGRVADGATADEVAHVGLNAVESFRDMYLVPERVTVVAAGDFDPKVLVHTLDATVGAMKVRRASADAGGGPATAGMRKVTLIDRPHSAQSNVAVGFPGPAATDAELPALEVLAAATGGALSSRLNLTIRKELGASYGVHMGTRALRRGGALTVSAAIDTARTAEAMKGLMTELERLGNEPLGRDELAFAKVRASDWLDQNSARGVAIALGRAAAEGRPADALGARNARIDALTAEDERAAAAKWVRAGAAHIVIVGDAAAIETDLRAAGFDVER